MVETQPTHTDVTNSFSRPFRLGFALDLGFHVEGKFKIKNVCHLISQLLLGVGWSGPYIVLSGSVASCIQNIFEFPTLFFEFPTFIFEFQIQTFFSEIKVGNSKIKVGNSKKKVGNSKIKVGNLKNKVGNSKIQSLNVRINMECIDIYKMDFC